MPWWAPIAANVGGALINKVLGSGEQRQQQSVDLKKMVADAQAAGFNPLTVLNATGGQGWGSQVSATDLDFGTMAAGAALQGIGDFWGQQQNRELLNAQIDLAKAQTASLKGAYQAGPFSAPVQDVSGTKGTGGQSPQVSERLVTGHTWNRLSFPKGSTDIPIELTGPEIPVDPHGNFGLTEPGSMTVVGRDGQTTTIPYVEVEGEGFFMGIGIALEQRLQRSTAWQSLKDSSVGSALSNIPKAASIVLNPEQVTIPAIPSTSRKKNKAAATPGWLENKYGDFHFE